MITTESKQKEQQQQQKNFLHFSRRPIPKRMNEYMSTN